MFDDLLGLTTAPGQVATLLEVNPGVPVHDGQFRYRLLPGMVMQVEGAEWPFAGGKLILEPSRIELASDAPRKLSFLLEGVDAAQFLERFDFENINATGTFDGVLPMVFDQDGGRIVGGHLSVRESGGSLAYVGQLTYEDLGTFGNFAFNALKSLRYNSLTITMDGPLDGEMLTQVSFGGVRQGEGAARNFITRQLDGIPLRFNISIRAPFMQLLSSARSLYDTQYLPDPATLGILPGQAANPNGKGLPNPAAKTQNGSDDKSNATRDEPTIQPPASENRP